MTWNDQDTSGLGSGLSNSSNLGPGPGSYAPPAANNSAFNGASSVGGQMPPQAQMQPGQPGMPANYGNPAMSATGAYGPNPLQQQPLPPQQPMPTSQSSMPAPQSSMPASPGQNQVPAGAAYGQVGYSPQQQSAGQPMPGAPAGQGPAPGQMPPAPAAQQSALNVEDQVTADDARWIGRTKHVIAQTQGDPFRQVQLLQQLRVMYLKERYNRTVQSKDK